jgi:hypothetical protein
MNVGMPRVVLAALAILVTPFMSGAAAAAPIPVKIDLTALRAIQQYTMKEGAEDDVYVVVTGVAKGQDVNNRLPESGTLKASPKKPPITAKQPATLWQGELADGEFAFLQVLLMHGDGKDQAKLKAFQEQLAPSVKGAKGKKTITSDEFDNLLSTAVKGQQQVVTKVKETFAREKKTDHYGGLFNVMVWNSGGKISKRVDPVGLTFGEHYGIDPKIYTKLKYTRPNVLVQDEGGDWNELKLAPVSDEEDAVRVKMLETEYVKGGDVVVRKVTDYLADVMVTADGKPLTWELGGEQTGPGELHTYWEYAE